MKAASTGSNLGPRAPAPVDPGVTEAPPPPPQQPPPPPPPVASADEVVLDQFPLLSQKDRANYADNSAIFDAWDTDKTGVKRRVPALACLAAVYTMIERATGDPNAKIDTFYTIGQGAMRGHLSKMQVADQVAIDLQTIASELRTGRPVILHGTGGALIDHYVLVVGMSVRNASVSELIVNDPFPDAAAPDRGKRVRIPVSTMKAGFSTYDGMRLVSRKTAPPPRAEAPPSAPRADGPSPSPRTSPSSPQRREPDTTKRPR